jgi:hypothetical protein
MNSANDLNFLFESLEDDEPIKSKFKKRAYVGFEIKRANQFKKRAVFKDCLCCEHKNLLPNGIVKCAKNKTFYFDSGCRAFEPDR